MTENLVQNQTDLEIFLSDSNFLLAWETIRNSLRYEVKDRLALEVFASNRDKHLQLLAQSVKTGEFQPSPCDRIFSPKSDGTLRPFAYLTIRDRVIYQALGNVILRNSYQEIRSLANKSLFAHVPQPPNHLGEFKPFMFEPTFSRHGWIGQFNRYEKRVFEAIEEYAAIEGSWMVQTDIASYYPSIDHNLLISLLETKGWLKAPELRNLLHNCLKGWTIFDGAAPHSQGLPIGYETSDLLSTLFLLPITQELSQNTRILQYVDDIYFFSNSRRDARKRLIDIDFALQARALVRNSQKTQLTACTPELLNEKRLEHELRSKLSALRIDFDGSEEDREAGQLAIYTDFMNLYTDELLSNVEALKEIESQLCFILYRLKVEDESAKNLAVTMLELFPHRTLYATQYLKQFPQDANILSFLLYIAKTSLYTEVKLRCAEAFIELVDYYPSIVDLLQEWVTTSQDWLLRYESLKLLSKIQGQAKFAASIALKEVNTHVKAQALVIWFDQSPTERGKVLAINSALCTKNYYLQSLAYYLWRRQIDIDRSHLDLTDLLPELKDFFLTEIEIDAVKGIPKKLYEIFGVNVHRNLPLHKIFTDVAVTFQHLVNIQDSETNMEKLVGALYSFMQSILTFVVTGKKANSRENVSILDLLTHIHDETFTLSELIVKHQQINFKNADHVSGKYRDQLIDEAKKVLVSGIRKIHQQFDLEVNDLSNVERLEVFISYSHKDTRYLEDFQTMLKPSVRNRHIQVWEDTRLKASDHWHEEIQAALKRAKVAVLLVTPKFLASDYIQDHELTPILKAAREEGLTIIWVSVETCMYEETELKNIQCANGDPKKTIASLARDNRNKLWKYVVTQIVASLN
jgi:hypothetical protein